MARWFLVLAAAAMVCLAGWLFYDEAWTASRGGVSAPMYSSERYDPYGTAALYRLFQRQSHPVSRLLRPNIPDDLSGVLIQVIPSPKYLTLPQPVKTTEEHAPESDQKQVKHIKADKLGKPDQQDKKDKSDKTADAPPLPVQHLGEPDQSGRSTADVLAWVSQGNTLIQFSRVRTSIMDTAGIPEVSAPPRALDTIKAFEASKADGHASDHAKAAPPKLDLTLESLQRRGMAPDELPLLEPAQWTDIARERYHWSGPGPLLRVPLTFGQKGRPGWEPWATVRGQVVAGQMRYGRGRIVVIGAPTPALNHMLGEGGNLPFILGLVGDQPVIFDAWIHNLGQASTLMSLIRHFGLLPLLLQLVLLVLVYHWSTQSRRQATPPEIERPRSSVEQIHTLGYLYQQGMSDRVVTMRAVREIRRRVAMGLSCHVGLIDRRLEQVDAARASEARELLGRAKKLVDLWQGCCVHCGYALKDIRGGHCPGCGQAVPISSAATAVLTRLADAGTPRKSVLGELERLLSLSHDFATGKKL